MSGCSGTGKLGKQRAAFAAAMLTAAALALALALLHQRAHAQERAWKPAEVFRDCAECPQMVVIPAGEFRMGSLTSESARYADEEPTHIVRFSRPFALGRYEISVAEFRRFALDADYETDLEIRADTLYKGVPSQGCYAWDASDRRWEWRRGRSWRSPGFPQDDRHPVTCVSWNDARAYAEWLSRKTGKRYRLASEAEWEYAARAGTPSARFWGDEAERACRHANVADRTLNRILSRVDHHDCDDGYLYTAPIGTFQPNQFGIYDILGNLWEWVEDCVNVNYESAPADGSAWARGDCSRRIVRGGGWFNDPRDVRSARRGNNHAFHRSINSGIRIARTLE